jgi:hypothetical protein
MPRSYYHVYPRYTSGSPAQVPYDTAQRVVTEERRAFLHALSGVMGRENQIVAQELGLHGIVIATQELSRRRVRITDMMEDWIVDLDHKLLPHGARWVWAVMFHLPSVGSWLKSGRPGIVRTVASPCDCMDCATMGGPTH